ncbi:MAG: acetyl-coenzyme A synthetase, partial [Alphaproteobacteria bacterium]|nr:acetyl-coenzyme A synthetase [Alphaproteobacteria bacterium]
MPDTAVNMFPVPRQVAQSAWVSEKKYFDMYEDSIKNPERFWTEHGKRLDWIKPFTKAKNTSFDGNVSIKW